MLLSTLTCLGSSVPKRLINTPSAGAAAASRAGGKRPVLRVIHSHVHDPFFNISFEGRLYNATVEAEGKADESAAAADAQVHPANAPASVKAHSGNTGVMASAASAPAAASASSSSLAESLFRSGAAADHVLFLWSNDPSVILGKHQHAHREVHLTALRERGVHLVRRHSGGGAVYQDRGNAIFTFISRDTPDNKEQHNRIILGALRMLGIEGQASGRNDFEVDGKKVSGCAFRRDKGWLLHHGTMLVHTDLAALPSLLSPSAAKLRAKGVTSVSARVRNLAELRPGLQAEQWDQALLHAFLEEHGAELEGAGTVESPSTQVLRVQHVEPSHLPGLLSADAALEQSASALRSYEWVHGNSPEFSHEHTARLGSWGSVTLGFQVGRGGVVEQARAYSDALVPQMVDELNTALAALAASSSRYGAQEVDAALAKAQQQCSSNIGQEAADNVQQLRDWMATQL